MASNFTDDVPNISEEDLGHVVAFCWERGKMATAYYNLSNYELFVSHEILDYSPEFAITLNLLRQIRPLHIIASGPNYFLNELLAYFNLPKDMAQYRVKDLRATVLLPLIFCPQNEKHLAYNRRAILNIKFPGIPEEFSEAERVSYIDSMLPLHQPLVVHSLGILLEYVSVNRGHLFLGMETDVVVSNLRVYKLQTEVPMDDFIINSLQIFAENNYHPSGYKKGENNSVREGFSVFTLLDNCFSRLGSKTMKMMLAHPIHEQEPLNLRYATIYSYLKTKSSDQMDILKKYLKNIGDVSHSFRNLVQQPEKLKNWHYFKKIVYNAYMAMKTCKELGRDAESNTLFAEVATAVEDEEYLLEVLHILDNVVDLSKDIPQIMFSVRTGLDGSLDEKKMLMMSTQNLIQESVQNELQDLSTSLTEISCYYIPEVGYVIKIDVVEDQPHVVDQLNANFTLVSRSDGSFYFQNNLCNELNEKYGDLFLSIREHEARICQRLILFLKERLTGIQAVVKLCAQLDCVLSFAKTAADMNLTKPEIVADKVLEIHQGRHLLWECVQRMIPNDFNISADNNKLVTLISAPNSSGKSVYLMQVALTVYLIHIGSFVPASKARVGLLDSIYSRINCPESVYGNNSSFQSDVRQLGKVMSNSSSRSLILIDEFGKGTSLLEAQALLASCIEHLTQRGDKCPITLISTHYADIYDIVQPSCKNMIAMKTFENVTRGSGEMISTFRLKEGRSVREYATKISGVKEFMEQLENGQPEESPSLIDIKIGLAVFMVWLKLNGRQIDYKKIVETVVV